MLRSFPVIARASYLVAGALAIVHAVECYKGTQCHAIAVPLVVGFMLVGRLYQWAHDYATRVD